ncbi:MAG: TIGR01212 family radical SAM protein, partial [Verrucomicrobiota bacterium]
MSTYLTYRQFLNQRYGGPARRVPVDLGFGCPHRDDSTGKGGCVFCGEDAGRAVHVWKDMDLKKQLQAGIMQVEQDYPDWDIMAYFQAFTSTYAEVDVLRERVKEVTECADFRSLIFGTRPDCLPPDIIAYLNELAEKYDVWVELGVQTANETTLKRINRGHNFACVRDAVQRLHKSGINVACHVILGLPGEGINDFRRTAEAIAALPFIGVKIHHLQVVKESRLACLWEQGDVKTYNEFEYTDVLIDFLRRIPPHWPVMRLMSEAIPTSLLAPRWRMTKAEFLNYLTKEMTRR